MRPQRDEPGRFVPGAVVEVVVEDAEMDHHQGDRGTVLVRDALGDVHIRWDKGLLDVWHVPDAEDLLRVIGER
jgi:uncharacterized protein DUF4314